MKEAGLTHVPSMGVSIRRVALVREAPAYQKSTGWRKRADAGSTADYAA